MAHVTVARLHSDGLTVTCRGFTCLWKGEPGPVPLRAFSKDNDRASDANSSRAPLCIFFLPRSLLRSCGAGDIRIAFGGQRFLGRRAAPRVGHASTITGECRPNSCYAGECRSKSRKGFSAPRAGSDFARETCRLRPPMKKANLAVSLVLGLPLAALAAVRVGSGLHAPQETGNRAEIAPPAEPPRASVAAGPHSPPFALVSPGDPTLAAPLPLSPETHTEPRMADEPGELQEHHHDLPETTWRAPLTWKCKGERAYLATAMNFTSPTPERLGKALAGVTTRGAAALVMLKSGEDFLVALSATERRPNKSEAFPAEARAVLRAACRWLRRPPRGLLRSVPAPRVPAHRRRAAVFLARAAEHQLARRREGRVR